MVFHAASWKTWVLAFIEVLIPHVLDPLAHLRMEQVRLELNDPRKLQIPTVFWRLERSGWDHGSHQSMGVLLGCFGRTKIDGDPWFTWMV